MRLDIVLLVVFLVLLFLSLAALSWSRGVASELLVGFGFLAAYALTSRSETLLGVKRRSAVRIVCSEVFALLAVAAAGGAASILISQKGVFRALTSGSDSGSLFTCLIVDMETFYLTRPLLLQLTVVLALVAFVALFMDNFQLLTRPVIRRLKRGKPGAADCAFRGSLPRLGRLGIIRAVLPYVVLMGSVALGVAITMYPYRVANVGMILGSDMWFYYQRLHVMMVAANPVLVLESDRGLFMLTLFVIVKLTGMDIQSVLILMPALCSTLLAVGAFVLVREGTGRSWVAGFAALLSVVSAQTSLGMGAGILANWFSLSVANFMFTFVLRWVRLRSWLAAVGAVVFSMLLLGSYAYMWVAAVGMLMIALVATLLSFRSQTRLEWKYESASLGLVLVGCLVLPVVVAWLLLVPLLGRVPPWFDAGAFLSQGWRQLVSRVSSHPLPLAASALDEAFDFAGNRVDLPFLTILSIVGLLDPAWKGSFRRLVAAMVLVPIVVAAISPNMYDTWRGLYVVPMYLTGALGVAGITRLVNGLERPWWIPSRLAFAGTFAGYVFLAHLSYSLRALWLLILVAVG
jgi:hypothetical protein